MTEPPPSPLLRLAIGDDGAAEIFRSIQGEGPMGGRVRAFIRLSGCNLHCRWCDTPYTWNWEGTPYPHEDGVKYQPSQESVRLTAREAARQVVGLGAPGVVVTGGEPLMQPRGLAVLMGELRGLDPAIRIEVETNGTIAPSPEIQTLTDLFVVSPKLAHAGNAPEAASTPLQHYRRLEQAVFKFVASEDRHVSEVASLTSGAGIEPARVWIMPEGRSPAELDRSLGRITSSTLAASFNLTDRQHIRLFGDSRGT